MSESRRFREATGRKASAGYVNIPRVVLPRLALISAHAVKLFIDLYGQYNGKNNGDFTAAWRIMRDERGWKSRDTLAKALRELQAYGLIFDTRRGGEGHRGRKPATLWAVTFHPVDECKGKLAVRAGFYHGGYCKPPDLSLLHPKTHHPSRPACQSAAINTPSVLKNLQRDENSGLQHAQRADSPPAAPPFNTPGVLLSNYHGVSPSSVPSFTAVAGGRRVLRVIPALSDEPPFEPNVAAAGA